MKKLFSFMIMTLLLVGLAGIVSAEEENATGSVEVSAGVAPGNFFYGFDKAFDGMRYAFAFNKEKKAELALLIAEERFAEAQKLAEQGKFRKLNKTERAYQKNLKRAEKAMKRIEMRKDLNESEKAVRMMERIRNRAEKHEERIAQMRLRLLEKYGDNLTEEQQAEIEDLLSEVESNSEEFTNQVETRRQNLLVAYKVIANLSDEELEEALDRIEAQEGIAEQRQARVERMQKFAQREVEVRQRNLERMKQRIENSNMTEEQKQKMLARVDMQEQKFDQFKQRKEALAERRMGRFQQASEVREMRREAVRKAVEAELQKRNSSESEIPVESPEEIPEEVPEGVVNQTADRVPNPMSS